jgi:hypothetical protein
MKTGTLKMILAVGLISAAAMLVGASSGTVTGIGDTLRFPDAEFTGFTLAYATLERQDTGEVIHATSGAAAADTAWADSAIALGAGVTGRASRSLTLPAGMTRGGNYLLRFWGSADATADAGDTLIASYLAPIAGSGNSPSFAQLPVQY